MTFMVVGKLYLSKADRKKLGALTQILRETTTYQRVFFILVSFTVLYKFRKTPTRTMELEKCKFGIYFTEVIWVLGLGEQEQNWVIGHMLLHGHCYLMMTDRIQEGTPDDQLIPGL